MGDIVGVGQDVLGEAAVLGVAAELASSQTVSQADRQYSQWPQAE
jgi:hypothetical protein